MQTSLPQTIILGGGLAGLSAAYHGGFPVYEAQHRAGGTAASENRNGFVFDIGIHILHSKNEYFLSLLDKLGVSLVTHKRSGWIYSHRHYFPYPFQVNTSHLPLSVRLKCLTGYLFRKNGMTPANYEEWIMQNFGQGFADTFLVPYARKFWGVSPQEMTFEWAGARVPTPRTVDVLKGAFWNQETDLGTHLVFQYPAHKGAGFSAIALALEKKVPVINYNMKATSIDPRGKRVIFNNGDHDVQYDNLISTIPLPDILNLLPDVPGDIRNAVQQLDWNSIAVINLGVNRHHISDKHWVHFPEDDISFFRISFPANFCDGLTPSGTSSIQAEVSFHRQSPPEKDSLINRVCDDLIKVGVLTKDDELIFKDLIFQKYGYVIYNHNREKAVKAIHAYLNTMKIYPCGRYGDWEYLWSDEAILSGKELAEKLSITAEGTVPEQCSVT